MAKIIVDGQGVGRRDVLRVGFFNGTLLININVLHGY